MVNEKNIFIIITVILFTSCINSINKSNVQELCLIDFYFERRELGSPGPDGLICAIAITDKDVRKLLLSTVPPANLKFNYFGGIYNIDSLRFPSPAYNINDINDSTIVFVQGVIGLRAYYPELFLDSIMDATKKELVIEIIDTLNGQKWLFPNCSYKLTTVVDWFAMQEDNERRKREEYFEEMEREEQIKAKCKVMYYLYNFFAKDIKTKE